MRSAAALSLLAAIGALASSQPAFAASAKGDPVQGEKVHAVCLDCHGTGIYSSQQRKIKSLSSLRKEVARWGDYYNPALSKQDVEDVVSYLNSRFYRF